MLVFVIVDKLMHYLRYTLLFDINEYIFFTEFLDLEFIVSERVDVTAKSVTYFKSCSNISFKNHRHKMFPCKYVNFIICYTLLNRTNCFKVNIYLYKIIRPSITRKISIMDEITYSHLSM